MSAIAERRGRVSQPNRTQHNGGRSYTLAPSAAYSSHWQRFCYSAATATAALTSRHCRSSQPLTHSHCADGGRTTFAAVAVAFSFPRHRIHTARCVLFKGTLGAWQSRRMKLEVVEDDGVPVGDESVK